MATVGRGGATADGTGYTKTNDEKRLVKTVVLKDLASHCLQSRQWVIYRLFQPTIIPRHLLQNAIGSIQNLLGFNARGWKDGSKKPHRTVRIKATSQYYGQGCLLQGKTADIS